jgi:hypothetical protein
MTDEEWEALKPFVEAEQAAREAYNATQAWNTAMEPRARVEQAMMMERVRFEYQVAVKVLDREKRRILRI